MASSATRSAEREQRLLRAVVFEIQNVLQALRQNQRFAAYFAELYAQRRARQLGVRTPRGKGGAALRG